MIMTQAPTQPENCQGTQPWARRLRQMAVGLVAVTALSLSTAGTAFAHHDTEPAGFHPGAPGHDHLAGFHPGAPGHDHLAGFHPGRPGHGHDTGHHDTP